MITTPLLWTFSLARTSAPTTTHSLDAAAFDAGTIDEFGHQAILSPGDCAAMGKLGDKTECPPRGICEVDSAGFLRRIEELTAIARQPDGRIISGDRVLGGAAPVSMNLWGFTPDVFSLLEESLGRFLEANLGSEKAEHYIPSAVAEIITAGQATVRVLPTDSDWFGVTYREDKPHVVESIARLVSRGDYPATL